MTDDLERLLERAAIRGPYILVPASMGGLVAEMYARRHPIGSPAWSSSTPATAGWSSLSRRV